MFICEVKVSYVEIYLERLRDLLRPSNGTMKIRESKHGVYIQGVTEMYVREGQEVINLMQLGARNRTVKYFKFELVFFGKYLTI